MKNFILVTYEFSILDNTWEICNNYYVDSNLSDVIENLYHNDNIIILNVIYY